jgi:TldD protein
VRELLEELIQTALRRGASFADIRAGQETHTSISAEDGRIHDLSISTYRGASVRVLVGGAWGFGTTASLARADLQQCLEEALAMAAAGAGSLAEPARVAEAEPIEAESRLPFRLHPADISLAERAATVAAFEERARKHHPAIVNTRVGYGDGAGSVELVNSFGTYVRWEKLGCELYVFVTAADETTRQQAYEARSLPAGWEVVADLDVDAFAGGVAQRAVDLLSAVQAPAGTTTVILDPEIAGLITHEAFGHNCEADHVWAGESIVASKEGQQVASPLVTIVDDPTLSLHNGTFAYDDEGVPARRHVLVQEGVLTEYLHNLETAAYFGVPPNGAGRAGGIVGPPLPRMSNTFIAPGEDQLEALIADVRRGLLLRYARGGYVDTTRGHFSFEVETGYEIENGKLGRQVRNCQLTGYTLETLARVRGVSREFEIQDSGGCGKKGQTVRVSIGGPYLLVEELTIGGARLAPE